MSWARWIPTGSARSRRLLAPAGLVALLLGLAVVWRVWPAGGASPDAAPDGARQADTALQPAPRPTRPVSFADGCVTSECHGVMERAADIHAPVKARRCDLCHHEDAGDHTFPIAEEVGAHCTACHDVGQGRPFQHELLSGAGCEGCHDPHVSNTRYLLLSDTVAGTCEKCHAPAQDLLLHSPYESGYCTACHDPHEADSPALLRGGVGIEHCRMCHQTLVETFESVKRSHLKVERTCLACHNAHGTDYPGHLIGETGALCLSCHEEIKTAIDTAVVSHEAVLDGKRCLSCHDPHASDRPMMLRDGQAQVCLECHSKEVVTPDGRKIPDMTSALTERDFSHGPVRAEQCSACHSIHGALADRLLREPAPAVLRGDFDVKNYALCFQCHTPALVLEERTELATRFRDGDRNLHYLHIRAGDGGRTCTSCHAVHGSDQPRHMAAYVRFEGSGWRMPVGFTPEEDGGRCASGCHEPLSYSRSRPAGAERPPEGGGR